MPRPAIRKLNYSILLFCHHATTEKFKLLLLPFELAYIDLRQERDPKTLFIIHTRSSLLYKYKLKLKFDILHDSVTKPYGVFSCPALVEETSRRAAAQALRVRILYVTLHKEYDKTGSVSDSRYFIYTSIEARMQILYTLCVGQHKAHTALRCLLNAG